jgi:hypothetical protein
MKSRWIGVALALLGAFGFALGVQSAWWSVSDVAIGPFGTRHCFGGDCGERGLAWIGQEATELWIRSAVATRAAGYIAMFALIMLAAGVAAKRQPLLVARGTLAAILTATATGIYFLAAFPGVAGASIDRGVFMYVGGILFGTVAAIRVLRGQRPAG